MSTHFDDGRASRAREGADDGGNSGEAALADGLGPRLCAAVAFATTEHFNLQTARAVTVSEARRSRQHLPRHPQLTLTAAGMVAVVNSVVVAACAGLVLDAAGVHSLALPVAVGAVIGAAAFSLHERHHRGVRDAYRPEAVDRAAIFLLPAQRAEGA